MSFQETLPDSNRTQATLASIDHEQPAAELNHQEQPRYYPQQEEYRARAGSEFHDLDTFSLIASFSALQARCGQFK
jgi:hypothetical protein